MQRFALIIDGRVQEIVEIDDEASIADRFHSSLHFVPAGSAAVGWVWDGTRLAAPAAPEPTAAELVAYAADLRWQREVGGIVVEGVPVATDDRSKVMIVGARVAAEANPDWSTTWHGADGQVYPIDAPAMIAISTIVEAHVNSGFATFAQVKADIEAGALTTRQQVADAFAA